MLHIYIYIYIYIYDISTLRVNDLTFILLTWRKWLAPNNASRQKMGFNSGFKGLILVLLNEDGGRPPKHVGGETVLFYSLCMYRCMAAQ